MISISDSTTGSVVVNLCTDGRLGPHQRTEDPIDSTPNGQQNGECAPYIQTCADNTTCIAWYGWSEVEVYLANHCHNYYVNCLIRSGKPLLWLKFEKDTLVALLLLNIQAHQRIAE